MLYFLERLLYNRREIGRFLPFFLPVLGQNAAICHSKHNDTVFNYNRQKERSQAFLRSVFYFLKKNP